MRARMVSLWLALVLGAAVSRADVPADAVWIDVRTPSEYARGHLPQARLIPFDGIEAGVAGLELSLEAPIYLYCAVGGRAEAAKQRLKAQGYSNVTNAGSLESARQMAGEAQR